MGLSEKYAFRAEMVRRLHDDLIGPRGGGDDETIDESPLDRYIAGVLWPADSGTQDAVAEEPVDGAGEETGPTDVPVSQSRMRFPSSAGMTFTVDSRLVDEVALHVSAARYLPGEVLQDAGQRSRARGQQRTMWRRSPVDVPPVQVALDGTSQRRRTVSPGLDLYA